MTQAALIEQEQDSKFLQAASVPEECESFPCETVYLGVDPGLSGALAVLWPSSGPWIYDAEEIRIAYRKRDKKDGETKSRSRGVFNAAAAAAAVREIRQIASRREWSLSAALEMAYAMPGENRGSSLTIGENSGIWIGIFSALSIPYCKISAAHWKQKLLTGLPHEKGSSVVAALRMFPQSHLFLKLAKHHGRADALMLAEYLRRKEQV